MNFSKLLRLAAVVGVVSIATTAISSSSLTADAQRRGSLRRFPLLENSNYRYLTSRCNPYAAFSQCLERGDYEIIVNRQLYTARFRMRAEVGYYTVLVADIDTDDFDTLTLQMAIPDYAAIQEQQPRILLYQGGNVINTFDAIEPGSIKNYVFNLDDSGATNPGDVSVEIQCDKSNQATGCGVYFLEAELSPNGNFISSNEEPPEWRERSATDSSSSAENDTGLVDAVEGIVEGFLGLFD